MKYLWIAPILAVLAVGCETTSGGGQLESTVYDTHRRVTRLGNDLGGSVDKLNETAAALSAQVSSNDQDMAELRSMLEENQMMLAQLERNLGDLQRVIYEEKGLTVPSGNNFGGGTAFIDPAPSLRPLDNPISTGMEDDEPIDFMTGTNNDPFDTEPFIGNNSAADEATADAIYEEAVVEFKAKNFAAALEGCNNVLQNYPNYSNYVRVLFSKARSEHGLGRYAEAIESYEKLRRDYPTDSFVPLAMVNQGVSHASYGEYDAAKSLWNKVITQYPTDAAASRAENYLEQLENR